MRKVILFATIVLTTFGLSAQTNEKSGKKIKAKEITKADFLKNVFNYEENPKTWKFEGTKPVIVDFYASWCGPCKVLAPILDELAAEYDGKIEIYKVNTETEKELAAVFGIRSIPSMLLIPMGEQPQMTKGALPKAQLKEVIDVFLLKNTPAVAEKQN